MSSPAPTPPKPASQTPTAPGIPGSPGSPDALGSAGVPGVPGGAVAGPRAVWEDRWNQPGVGELVEPIEENRRRVIVGLIEQLDGLEGIEPVIRWHGLAWKWTVQYELQDDQGKSLGALIYIVPRLEVPIVCIPLRTDTIDKLPLRRLSKYVREGIKIGKYSADTHWAVWTPSQPSDIEQLFDLVKRKARILRTGAADAAE